jgi:hypothetical protein
METSDRFPPLLQSRLDQLSMNNPYVTYVNMATIGSCVNGDDEMMALGLALQKSMHVTGLSFSASRLTSIQGCSTMEEYLKSTTCLQTLNILSLPESATSQERIRMAKITDRLLSAIRENNSTLLQKLTLSPTSFSCQTLSRYLSGTNSLQVLDLNGVEYPECSDLDIQTVGRAINQCHRLKEIDLGHLSQTWLISVFQHGLTNHPSVQKFSLSRIKSPDCTAAAGAAFRQMLDSSTPLRLLNFYICELPHSFMQHIIEGLYKHSTIESLEIDSCDCFDLDAVLALQKLLGSTHECKLQTLSLKDSIQNPPLFTQIFFALQQNTCLKHLDLKGYRLPDKDVLGDISPDGSILVEMILRNNPQMTRLSLDQIVFGEEAAVSFMKIAIQAPSLNRLDVTRCDFGDAVFENLASCPSIPCSSNRKKSVLQTLHVSGSVLSHNVGMQNLMKVLRRHTPHLKSLYLWFFDFCDNGAVQWAKSLQSIPLEKLFFIECDWNESIRQILIPTMLDNHPTLKCFELETYVHHTDLGRVIRMATESVRVCQLQRLCLDVSVDYDDYDSDDNNDNDSVEEEEEPFSDYDALLQALAANTTLTDVVLSEDIVDNMHTRKTKKVYFYVKRNEEFQKITPNLIKGKVDRMNGKSNDDELDRAFHVDDDEGLSMARVNGSGADSHSTIIPLGLWPHIFEAAYKQFPNVSMLHHLLSYQVNGPVLSEWEERDVLFCTATANEVTQCRNSKRDHCQISKVE